MKLRGVSVPPAPTFRRRWLGKIASWLARPLGLLRARSLEVRLVVFVSLGLMLFSSIAGLCTYAYEYWRQLKWAEVLQQQLVRTVQAQAEVAAYAFNEQIAQGVLEGLLANPIILAARIEAKEGFFYERGRGAGTAFAAGTVYPLYSPVNPSERVGDLVVVKNDVYIDDEAGRLAGLHALTLLLQVLMGAVLMIFVLRVVMTKPVTILVRNMLAVKPGGKERLHTPDMHANDEIGLLSSSVNSLLDAAEAAVREERSLHALLDATGRIARVGGWTWEVRTQRFMCSDEIYRICRIDPTQPFTLEIALSYFAPESRPLLQAAIVAALEHGDPFDLELQVVVQQLRIWVRALGESEQHLGKVVRLYGAFQDIHERKLAEMELRMAKQAAESASITKTRFLAAVGHDLRQPIQAISLFSHALSATHLNAEQLKISRFISMSVRSLNEQVNVLFDISRLDAGMVKPNLAWVQAEDLFERIEAEFAPLALSKHLRFKLFFPFHGLALRTDMDLLLGVLRNVIGNAIKYTKRGGVLVGIRRRATCNAIQVWDTGIGISAKHIVDIFDEYFQVGNPERDREKGLGLGLAIVQRLSKILGCSINCRSRLGRGSVFEIALPLSGALGGFEAESGMPSLFAATDCDEDSQLSGKRIFAIESDARTLEIVHSSLEALGGVVVSFATAEEALACAEIGVADLYLVNFALPGTVNGVELLTIVQQRAALPIKAIVMTDDAGPERFDRLRLSPWPVLIKPFDLSGLLELLVDIELIDSS